MTEVTNGDKVIMYYRKNEFNNGIFKTLKTFSIQKYLDDRRDGNRGYGFSRDDRGFGGDRYRRDDNNR